MKLSFRKLGEPLTDDQRTSLRSSYESGESITSAAKIAGLAKATVHRYFHDFAAQGLKRGPCRRYFR